MRMPGRATLLTSRREAAPRDKPLRSGCASTCQWPNFHSLLINLNLSLPSAFNLSLLSPRLLSPRLLLRHSIHHRSHPLTQSPLIRQRQHLPSHTPPPSHAAIHPTTATNKLHLPPAPKHSPLTPRTTRHPTLSQPTIEQRTPHRLKPALKSPSAAAPCPPSTPRGPAPPE